ncbi:MAG: 2-polyprenyl-6-methoxyphenol hydroxylase-like oxidoreductase [Nitrosopumilus sp.]|nr:2-polyprenyl-6-methoxyphenol hydroxylase-like oxidoreductase [Nitrosopumilus sp.]
MQEKAMVIGGSIAGLLAARVLSDHFKDIILIEKDSSMDDGKARIETPQANHIHILLVRGREILQGFFPELEKELLKKGANKIDFLNDSRYRLPSGWAPKFNSGIITFACTRTLLENTIRHQIQKIPKINIEQGEQITSFVLEKSNKISLKTKEGKEIHGDLIVDCTGRNTKTPTWLEDIGFPKPRETKIDSFVRYSTRRYIPSKKDRRWKMLAILNKPITNPRIGAIYPIEDGKWLVGLYSIGKNYPPTDEEGFLEFAQHLESRELYDALKDATPDSEIYGYQVQGSRKYHYEEMKQWPENFIVLGDAVSIFNPYYGQGMTSAALGAKTLDDMLKDNKVKKGFTRKFQKRLAKEISLPWILGTSEDLRWSTTVGKRPNTITRMVQNHAQKVLLLSPKSKLAAKSFQQMMHMIKSPAIIFHPAILLQLIANSIWKKDE